MGELVEERAEGVEVRCNRKAPAVGDRELVPAGALGGGGGRRQVEEVAPGADSAVLEPAGPAGESRIAREQGREIEEETESVLLALLSGRCDEALRVQGAALAPQAERERARDHRVAARQFDAGDQRGLPVGRQALRRWAAERGPERAEVGADGLGLFPLRRRGGRAGGHEAAEDVGVRVILVGRVHLCAVFVA
jgi:hypothetical protein